MKSSTPAFVITCLLSACAPAVAPAPDTGAGAQDAALDAADVTLDITDAAAGDADAGTAAPECSVVVDASAPTDGGTLGGMHGVRYCEVLLANLASGTARVDVYNTLGVSDCPADAWAALDPAVLRAQNMVSVAVLNGPRYWLIDAFENSSLLDPAVRFFGCVPMRLAGRIEAPVSALAAAPYAPHTIMRDTRVLFASGSTVYELVDPGGQIYDMQSYSTQMTPQTEASLSTLGSRLTLPAGWSFRARALAADLRITAVSGLATVIQDDFKNTYQLSQQ
ncbi:MAG: hypothetical protein WCJ30_05680 [Deltaproteobacteria bacterium]